MDRPVEIEIATHLRTDIETAVEHHHEDTGETVPMKRLVFSSSDPDDDRLGEGVGWARQVWDCPKCGERVTLRLLVRSAASLE